MNTKQLVMAIVSTIVKVVVAVAVVVLLYKGATTAYDYGYRVFNEKPVSEAPGVDITVQITMGKDTMEIGKILVEKGLIRDANLFYIQNLLSQYKGKLAPGEYTLNTSMTMLEMMGIMAEKPEEEDAEEDKNSGVNSNPDEADAEGTETGNGEGADEASGEDASDEDTSDEDGEAEE